ncbi:uncharacterized protein LOC131858708 [Cryptomeria japonica]|uniref:uncharacterized protein LOC131858708 n=1 Tax=Cryptomeria japonica TaxID=3369 RepID=UPI0027DA65DA|nr:uncharacterized protein LOC131858708 [Cryptomeria japonica]
MGCSYLKNTHKLLWVIAIGIFDFTVYFALSQSLQCTHPPDVEEFVQLTDRFWAYDTHSNKWTQLELPFDLLSCNNGNCSKIGTIQDLNQDNENNSPPHDYNPNSREEQQFDEGSDDGVSLLAEEELGPPLVVRKRLSLTVMSETSVWITGESGSIYERFWNGMNWVTAPHELQPSAGYAISVFAVNHTFAALSEAGNLYQLTMDANAQPLWVECTPSFPSMANIDISDEDSSMSIRLRSGFPSVDGNSMYFSTVDGSLLELSELQPVRYQDGDSQARKIHKSEDSPQGKSSQIKDGQARTRATSSSLASTRTAFFGLTSSRATFSNPVLQGEVHHHPAHQGHKRLEQGFVEEADSSR